jgi:thiamine-monophosphate kinase
MATGEFEFIRWLRERTPSDPRVAVGPGDDCAVLRRPAGPVLVTTDVLTEGVDFLLAECGPRAVGRKAMAVNLSDIAATGGRPAAAVVGIVVPRAPGGRDLTQELHLGLREVADRFGVPLVGGDTNSWDGGLVISVTVLGEPVREPVLRSGAKPGDWVFVTGPLGGSIRGRHLTPTPRLAEAERLVTDFTLHAMIDVSDGLAKDVHHICEESRCGVVLTADAVPVHPDAVELSNRTGRPPLDHALSDGEDFELVFTVSPDDGAKLLSAPPVPVWKIGQVVAEPGLWVMTAGVKRPLPAAGWEHRL